MVYCRNIFNVLRYLVTFVRFKKGEKHPWRSVTFSTPPRVFFTFFKLYNWYQIVRRVTLIVTLISGLSGWP